jgi:hypothetical protein
MITVATQKRHKSRSKTIYVFPSGRVVVTVQIHSRKKECKGVKMTPCQMDINTVLLQDLVKRGVCRCGVEMPLGPLQLVNPG